MIHLKIDIKIIWKSSQFVFDYVQLWYYKCHKINLNLGGLCIDSLDWIKNKKAAINPINKKQQQMFSIRCNSRVKS